MQGVKRDYSGKVKCSHLSLEEQALYTTIPLWKVPYEDQVIFFRLLCFGLAFSFLEI